MQHTGLGHGISHGRIAGLQGRNRRGIDDGAATALLHVRHRVGRAGCHRTQQQVEGAVPAVGIKTFNAGRRAAGTGIAEQDVKTAEVPGRAVNGRLQLRKIGDVAGHELDDAGVARLKRTAGLGVHVGRHHLRAFGDKQLQRRQTDAGGGTGDDGYFSIQSQCHGVPAYWLKTMTLRAMPPLAMAAKPSLIWSSLRRPEIIWSSFRRPCM